MQTFWQAFENKDFVVAQKQLAELSATEQQTILANLFQQSQYAKMPHSISISKRELHNDKTFDDFYKAHHPPKDMCHPVSLFGKNYLEFFKAPIRVINAVNLNNPDEIVSVGLHWLNEEQQPYFFDMMANIDKDEGNKRRAEQIQKVAEHTGAGAFIVKTDDNLGTPF